MKDQLKTIIKKMPVVGQVTVSLKSKRDRENFQGSANFWEERYKGGGNSGSGSYGRLAEFKAEVLNNFVAEQKVETVLEFGCGDGNQLTLAKYPRYIGLDVSRQAIALCLQQFSDDPNKSFFLYDTFSFVDNLGVFQSDAVFSLDVIYHLIEDEVYRGYMAHLFSTARDWVVIYSSDYEDPQNSRAHVRSRRFSSWVEENAKDWSLWRKVENRYPLAEGEVHTDSTSHADFYFFRRNASGNASDKA